MIRTNLSLLHMADIHPKSVRSYNMSMIRSKNTKPELLIRRFLHTNGFSYRLYVTSLPGKPDIVLPKYHKVIFIHGCFWHAHKGCKYFQIPSSRKDYWLPKLISNRNKDALHQKKILLLGWQYIIVWECELKGEKQNDTLKKIARQITK